MDISGTKKKIRELALSMRKLEHARVGPSASKDIAQVVVEFLVGRPQYLKIGTYISINSEVGTSTLIRLLLKSGYDLAVPVVVEERQPLSFQSFTEKTDLVEGKYCIPIPKNGEPLLPDVIICPLLSYDSLGYRLGYGGGFYDRTIGNLRSRRSIFALGLSFASQRWHDYLPKDKFDQRLDGIATENGVDLF